MPARRRPHRRDRKLSYGVRLIALLVACSSPRPAKPAATADDPIGVIAELFDRHDVVGIPERHRNKEVHDFLGALIRDARLSEHGVTDIVVEFGTARFQHVADRYFAGEPVPIDEVRRMWRDTGQFLSAELDAVTR